MATVIPNVSSVRTHLLRGMHEATTAGVRGSSVRSLWGFGNYRDDRDMLTLHGGIYVPVEDPSAFAIAACRVEAPRGSDRWRDPAAFILGVGTTGGETFYLTRDRFLVPGDDVFTITGTLGIFSVSVTTAGDQSASLLIDALGTTPVPLWRMPPLQPLDSPSTQLLMAGLWGFGHDLPSVLRSGEDDLEHQAQVALTHATTLRERAQADAGDTASHWHSAGYMYQHYGLPGEAAYCLMRGAEQMIRALSGADPIPDSPARFGLLYQLRHTLEFALDLGVGDPDLRRTLQRHWQWAERQTTAR